MIYLRKKIEDSLERNTKETLFFALDDGMISFDDYMNEIKNMELTEIKKFNIQFKLDQLANIYLESQILYKWCSSNSDNDRNKLYFSLFDKKRLSEVIDIFDKYFTHQRFVVLNEKIQDILIRSIDEAIEMHLTFFNDPFFSSVKDADVAHKTTEMKIRLSYLLSYGLCTHFRIYPFPQKVLQTVLINQEKFNIIDFIDSPLYLTNNRMEPEQRIDNIVNFFNNRAIECLSDYIQLAELLYTLDNKLEKNITLKEKYYFSIEEEKVMFLELQKNKYYQSISLTVPIFEQYCYILISNGYLIYKNNILQKKELNKHRSLWSKFYFYKFLNDEKLDLNLYKKLILKDYKKLIGIEKLEDNPSVNATGYEKNNITQIILEKMKYLRK